MGDSPGTLIVTGASRGIGAAVARQAAARLNYAVAVNFSTDVDGAGSVVSDITAAGGRALAIRADVRSEDEILHLFEQAERELGPIRALVNNAGITGGLSRLEDLSASTLADVLAVNLTGTILCSREAIRRMSIRRGGTGGAIVNLSSLAARIGGGGEWVHYAATKGAVESFTIGLAREVAGEGIRVNAVAPGLIETDIHALAGVPERPATLGPTVPIGRSGSADEVAEAICWLLSSSASYVIGTIVEVGGGR